MILAIRRLMAGLAVGLVVAIGGPAAALCMAETASPTPVGTATATAGAADPEADPPNIAPDNSRQVWALGGAAALAVIAAAVVFLRRG